jgi:poly-beta-1,6-N-acetyl-D-glucosamine synthase
MTRADTIMLGLFVLSLLQLGYTFAGYGIVLAVWKAIGTQPIGKLNVSPTVAVVIVVHNGEHLIKAKIETCLNQDYAAEKVRIVIASDGSDDRTEQIIGDLQKRHASIDLIRFAVRRGKAACLNDAVATCNEEIIVFTDVRQRLNKEAITKLVENLSDGSVGAVSGQLMFELDGSSEYGKGLDAYWRYEKFLRASEASVSSSVGVSGALYAMRRSLFKPIAQDTILDDLLIPMNVVRQGRRVAFESSAIAYDRPAASMSQERSRKVRTLGGNFQLIFREPWLLVPFLNPIAFQFWSHKVMRLLAPMFLCVALGANVYLAISSNVAQTFFVLALGLQIACYAMAITSMLSPRLRRWLPLRLSGAFLSLNWFVVMGFVQFCLNRRAHLWQNTSQSPQSSVARRQS